jgi:pyruvate/2-oxoglutarate/acetoin dehydrogenase E1 component
MPETTVLHRLNTALHQALAADARVYLLGEDILDPYGGAFKVTGGLSTAFPDRVLTTPVSEAGLVGVAAGMALRGLRPVVEIMFGDFITLIADQLINSAAKFRWMYNEQVELPLVIRTPMGGRRGYGPTHSQTLEKLFLGVPGLCVLAPCTLGDPGELLKAAILEIDDPVLFVENKLLYLRPVFHPQEDSDYEVSVVDEAGPANAPTYRVCLRGAPRPAVTLAAYGYMAELAREAVRQLAYESEIFVELLVPSQLAPFRMDPVVESAARTRRLLVVEEGTRALGWGAEVVAQAAEALGPELLAVRRLGAADTPIPASEPLEAVALPGVESIIKTAQAMV